jgi:hypothetical protein
MTAHDIKRPHLPIEPPNQLTSQRATMGRVTPVRTNSRAQFKISSLPPPRSQRTGCLPTLRGRLSGNAVSFPYNQIVSVKEHDSSSGTIIRNYYCIDKRTAKVIKAATKNRLYPQWRKEPGDWRRVNPNNELRIWDIHCGWLAFRDDYRPWAPMLLGHQLGNIPLLFPTATIARAAAELSSRASPNSKIPWMWWTVPLWQ